MILFSHHNLLFRTRWNTSKYDCIFNLLKTVWAENKETGDRTSSAFRNFLWDRGEALSSGRCMLIWYQQLEDLFANQVFKNDYFTYYGQGNPFFCNVVVDLALKSLFLSFFKLETFVFTNQLFKIFANFLPLPYCLWGGHRPSSSLKYATTRNERVL